MYVKPTIILIFSKQIDSGDKSVQCGRKSDAFKIWFMLKVRGEDYVTRLVENAFDKATLMASMIKGRDGFRLVLEPSCTNVCFVYIPPSLRNQTEDDEWKEKLDQVRNTMYNLFRYKSSRFF